MKGLVFPLALLLVAACGSSSKKSDAKTDGSPTAKAPDSLLVAVYEIRETDGGKQVGTLYKRDYGNGRFLYWVEDIDGKRLGYVTTDNQAYAYEWVMGKRSNKAEFIGEDTMVACTRKVLDHDRAVTLEQIDIETWVRKGTALEKPREVSKPGKSTEDAGSADESDE